MRVTRKLMIEVVTETDHNGHTYNPHTTTTATATVTYDYQSKRKQLADETLRQAAAWLSDNENWRADAAATAEEAARRSVRRQLATPEGVPTPHLNYDAYGNVSVDTCDLTPETAPGLDWSQLAAFREQWHEWDAEQAGAPGLMSGPTEGATHHDDTEIRFIKHGDRAGYDSDGWPGGAYVCGSWHYDGKPYQKLELSDEATANLTAQLGKVAAHAQKVSDQTRDEFEVLSPDDVRWLLADGEICIVCEYIGEWVGDVLEVTRGTGEPI